VNYKDPDCSTNSTVIGERLIHRALLDLGTIVNWIPYTECKRLGLGKLKPTKMVAQLANKLTRLPRGVVEDVFIRVSEFIYLWTSL